MPDSSFTNSMLELLIPKESSMLKKIDAVNFPLDIPSSDFFLNASISALFTKRFLFLTSIAIDHPEIGGKLPSSVTILSKYPCSL